MIHQYTLTHKIDNYEKTKVQHCTTLQLSSSSVPGLHKMCCICNVLLRGPDIVRTPGIPDQAECNMDVLIESLHYITIITLH